MIAYGSKIGSFGSFYQSFGYSLYANFACCAEHLSFLQVYFDTFHKFIASLPVENWLAALINLN